jgi:hypothetical protein
MLVCLEIGLSIFENLNMLIACKELLQELMNLRRADSLFIFLFVDRNNVLLKDLLIIDLLIFDKLLYFEFIPQVIGR